MPTVGSPLLWATFIAGVLALIAIDLGVFNRSAHRVTVREAAIWSAVWVLLSLAFDGFVWARFGAQPALEFLSAYLVEKSLSVDNLFVFLVIFRYMDVRPALMHRVLFAGIVGALVLRGVFILAGIELIAHFAWTLYVFGGFLLVTGFKLLLPGEEQFDPSENLAYRMARRVMRITRTYHGTRFLVREGGRLHATPLFLVLLMVETSDVVFALDSIPAVFGISRDPFIVFTSNVCAVMGLRAMFFLLQHVLDRFAYLKYGLGLVLAFIGGKMILEQGVPDVLAPVHIPIVVSLAVVAGLLALSVVVSLVFPPQGPSLEEQLAEQPEASLLLTHEELAAHTPGASTSEGAAASSAAGGRPPDASV
ncbi:MAG: TerC family protein [Deltaproteobacteria bacterium]|nr:MAG: TerC family protein [Deltaproteobacteria bacterium]